MKDRELELYEIMYGGCIIGFPFFLCPGGMSWRLVLLFADAFLLYQVSLRKRSILLYLLLSFFLAAVIPQFGQDLAEKACLFGGSIMGSAGFFYGRWKGGNGFFGGPSYYPLALPAAAYLVAYAKEFPYVRERACVFAAAVILLAVLFRNRQELLLYVKGNEKLHRFPGKRLETKNRRIMLLFCLVLFGAMVMGYFGAPEDPSLKDTPKADLSRNISDEEVRQDRGEMDMSALLEDGEEHEPPAWLMVLGELLYWTTLVVLGVGMVIGAAYGVWRLIFNYRDRYNRGEGKKVVMEDDVMENLAPPRLSFSKLFRRKSTVEKVRSAYRKWVLGGPGQTPGTSFTPQEAEMAAMVQDEDFHALYERVRYGRKECSQEELNQIRRKIS